MYTTEIPRMYRYAIDTYIFMLAYIYFLFFAIFRMAFYIKERSDINQLTSLNQSKSCFNEIIKDTQPWNLGPLLCSSKFMKYFLLKWYASHNLLSWWRPFIKFIYKDFGTLQSSQNIGRIQKLVPDFKTKWNITFF